MIVGRHFGVFVRAPEIIIIPKTPFVRCSEWVICVDHLEMMDVGL